MRKKTGKKSFRNYILFSILALITCIFIGIYASFNILVSRYIEKKAVSDLNKVTQSMQSNYNTALNNFSPKKGHEYEKKIHSVTNGMSNVNIIAINNDYEIINPASNYINLYDFYDIKNYLKDNNVDLSSEKMKKAEIEGESYYLTIRKCNDCSEEKYYVFLAEVTSEEHLAKKMNVMLFIIMTAGGILAVLLSLLLSKKIVRPIKMLCDFADRIGKGNFKRYDADFSYRETDQLLNVMNEAVTALDKYDNEQKIFFQNASHELRTPLMSIKGYAEGIKYNILDKDTASDIILQEENRLEGLVEELLYISRIDNITNDYVQSARDLREILSDCIVRQKAIAINKGIEFVCEFSDEPCILNCDEKSIFKAFSNIINNSLRYSKKRITVGCRKEKEKVIVYIENDGEQIKEEEIDKIFERFYKGEKGKHGIGLSIVKSVITRHGGEIIVQNVKNGVRFTMTFLM